MATKQIAGRAFPQTISDIFHSEIVGGRRWQLFKM
jgi:hypothetical protein